ncbi:hypothetical protein NFI96_020806 [Prochilodus magdalenae]|nr:hypothetical protein NFI96_020806 [Prochilodus magdalenae]
MGLYLSDKTVDAGLYKASQHFNYALEFLLQDVFEFDIQDKAVPSEILVCGPLAFPIGLNPDEKVFLAGAYYVKGRVIVASHETYIGRKSLSTFMGNAIQWLAKRRNGVIGVLPELEWTCSLLSKSGLQCQVTGFKKDLSVFVCTSYNDAQSEEILEFVAGGGGLLIGGHAWWWAQCNPGQNVMTDCSGNHANEWISTGLYLPPGLNSNVTVPGTIIGKGWQVQIGCQSDDLSKADELKRAPVVCVSFPLEKENTEGIGKSVGEDSYTDRTPKTTFFLLVSPTGHYCSMSNHSVILSGKDQCIDWVSQIRKAPAPWEELEIENLHHQLAIRDDTKTGSIQHQVAKLLGFSEIKLAELLSLQSFPAGGATLADVQISAGLYPIVFSQRLN